MDEVAPIATEQTLETDESRRERRLIREREVALAREEERIKQLPWHDPETYPDLLGRDTQPPQPREPKLEPPLRGPEMTDEEYDAQEMAITFGEARFSRYSRVASSERSERENG